MRNSGAAFFFAAWLIALTANAQTIGIQTSGISLVLTVEKSGEVRQSYFGARIESAGFDKIPSAPFPAYSTYGRSYVNEPALRVVHADGNLTTELVYQRHDQSTPQEGVTLTTITLK